MVEIGCGGARAPHFVVHLWSSLGSEIARLSLDEYLEAPRSGDRGQGFPRTAYSIAHELVVGACHRLAHWSRRGRAVGESP